MFWRVLFRRRPALYLLSGTVLLGCSERQRLVYEPPPNGTGPLAEIDSPAGDTIVSAGPGMFVTGRVSDPDGVDTVYFDVVGGVSQFPPFVGPQDTVRFALPITTAGQQGKTIEVRVYGVDTQGNQGSPAVRYVTVK